MVLLLLLGVQTSLWLLHTTARARAAGQSALRRWSWKLCRTRLAFRCLTDRLSLAEQRSRRQAMAAHGEAMWTLLQLLPLPLPQAVRGMRDVLRLLALVTRPASIFMVGQDWRRGTAGIMTATTTSSVMMMTTSSRCGARARRLPRSPWLLLALPGMVQQAPSICSPKQRQHKDQQRADRRQAGSTYTRP